MLLLQQEVMPARWRGQAAAGLGVPCIRTRQVATKQAVDLDVRELTFSNPALSQVAFLREPKASESHGRPRMARIDSCLDVIEAQTREGIANESPDRFVRKALACSVAPPIERRAMRRR